MRARGTGRKPRSASNDRVLSTRSTDRGAWHYARGLAYASKRDRKNLIAERDSLTAIVDKLSAGHQGSIRSGLGPCRRAAEPAIFLNPPSSSGALASAQFESRPPATPLVVD